MTGQVTLSEQLRTYPRCPLPEADRTPEQIVEAFNTWAFKRQQPSSHESLVAVVSAAKSRAEPVPFVLYWGKGPRSQIREAETQCLDYLARMGQRVAQVYAPGAHFKLLLTDTHAALNGHPQDDICTYFAEVSEAARERGFTTRLLSEVVLHAKVGAEVAKSKLPTDDTLRALAASAEKWYRGDGLAAEGAAAYFAMNMREKRAVEVCYPDAIFVTFNSNAVRVLFPDRLPIFYMYSVRKGCAVKPWFMDVTPATRFSPAPQAHGLPTYGGS